METGQDDYGALFDANPRPMFVSDQETLQILAVNRAACELYEWSREEMLAMTIRDIRPPEEIAFFEASFADPTKTRNSHYARAARHRTKSGKALEVSLEIARVTFADRAAALAIVTNLTGVRDVERRFQLLVEHSADGISLTNADNVIEYVSPGGLRILGYDDDLTLRGGKAGLTAHPDELDRWTPPAPGETKHHVARIQHRDGSWRWIESSTTNLTHDPVVRAFVSNYRDITERVVADQALRDSHQRFEFLLSATSAVTYTARTSGDTTFIGANVKQLLGHEPEEFYSSPRFWYDHVHPDDLGLVNAAISKLDIAEPPPPLQYRFQHRDGSYRWLRDHVRVLRDRDGKPIELVGYMIDVSDAVRADEAMRRSELNFRTLIERAPIATFVHHHGRYVYANSAASALLACGDSSQIVGRSVLDHVHPDDRDDLAKRMGRLGETGAESFSGLRLVRDDGSLLVLEGQAMLLDFDGMPCHVVMGHDVTERDALFARIAMADRMLSIGTLAAGVAHEINNPLAYVATNLELLDAELPNLTPSNRSRLNDATLQCLVHDAREGVARVNAIVRDLRSLSRSDEPKHGHLDIGEVLASSVKMTHNETRHRARVVHDHEPGLPPVAGDASRLGQVFVNLLLNSAQAIVDGRADDNEIRVCTSATPDRKSVRIDISDTGAGIPPAIVGRIFDPFFTTKAPGSGIGLGLAISHQIVQSMGGEIRVESKSGTGTTFTVILPFACDVAAEVRPTSSPRVAFTRRILLVDDEAAVGRSLQMLLAPETDVDAVVDAEVALARITRGEQYDAILCDLMMPRSSGMQLYEQIAAEAPDYLGRIIFMTGGAFTPQARAFLDKLDRPHLEKPFSEQELREAIASVTG